MTKFTDKNELFGKHLMLDMYHCAPETLNSRELVLNILNTLPGEIDMRILAKPVVKLAQPNGKKDAGGWSGFVMIHESHITIHTFIKRGFVTIDIYSCAPFDAKFLVSFTNLATRRCL